MLCVLLMACLAGLGYLVYDYMQGNKTSPYYLACDAETVEVMDKEGNRFVFPRGRLVNIRNRRAKLNEEEYCQFTEDGKTYLVKETYLVNERESCVLEKNLYALRDHVLSEDFHSYKIAGWVKKEEQLNVSGYHELREDGSVDYYLVNDTGFIPAKYVALQYHETKLDDSRYADVYFGDGGDPRAIDYYPKEDFVPKREMPEQVKALYINAEAIVDADAFIELASQCSGINAFVVDIKDCYIDTQLAYESPVGKLYAPSTENIPNSFETYRSSMKKLKDAGYYLIGRITAFKDDSFAIDNPDEALVYEGELYQYGSVKWPSVFSRKMWEYDVALALEAVEEMGFDEIQFDYVRLPEDVEDVDLKNRYGETRAQAVTNFLRYAAEILHDRGIYVSADVFGETSGDNDSRFSCFVSYYGQFWPAISNAVDAISSMPYPDHFSYYAYGIAEPWNEPGELMYRWGRATSHAQENTYDPARCRTWIMAQNSDVYEVFYDESFIKAQIDGLREAGVLDGYMTWNAASSISKYYSYASVLN